MDDFEPTVYQTRRLVKKVLVVFVDTLYWAHVMQICSSQIKLCVVSFLLAKESSDIIFTVTDSLTIAPTGFWPRGQKPRRNYSLPHVYV